MRLFVFLSLFALMAAAPVCGAYAQFFPKGAPTSVSKSTAAESPAAVPSAAPSALPPVTPVKSVMFQNQQEQDTAISSFGAAQEHVSAPGPAVTISAIRVEGTQRIEAETVRSYLSLAVGEAATAAKMNESLKSLFDTGFFADVKMQIDGTTLVVKVEENPVINRVVFEGNTAVDSKDLEKEVQMRPRQVYTKSRVKDDVKRLLDVYRRSGRFAALIEPKLIALEQNRVDLVFEITEGERTGVRRVGFVGNTIFSDDELREAINTRETAWWRVFTSADFYDPDRMNYDKELLRRFYMNAGYADFRVPAAKAELSQDRKDFYITFTIEEGQRYHFGKVDVTTGLRNIDLNSLKAMVTARQGEWYSAEKVEKSVALLTNAIADLQYGFAQVQPKVTQNKENRTVDVTFVINEGPRVFVQRIEIKGNTRTLDRVIRRQMKLSEGDAYLISNVKRSEQNIRDLGFFEDVKVTNTEGTQPDQSVINVDVKEKSTGEISIGAGFSSTDGALGDFSIRERNLLGKGQDLRFGVQASARTQQYDISFTEPYFLERDLATGFDLFRVTRDNQDTSSYDEARNGGNLRMGYALSEDLRQRWTYGLSRTEITNVPSTASRYVREQEGSTLTSMVGQELMYDKRDSKLNPTQGYYIRLNTDIAGLGGDTQFIRGRVAGAYFIPVSEKWTLTLGSEVGYIKGLGQDVRINDRFYLGGENLRGFEFAGIGPRDMTGGADDALGGNRFARARAELSFPIGLPEEFGVKGRMFTDAGMLDDVDVSPLPGDDIRIDSALRASAGIGVTWASPFGPIGIDLAQPILKKDYDKTEFFRFSFGTRF